MTRAGYFTEFKKYKIEHQNDSKDQVREDLWDAIRENDDFQVEILLRFIAEHESFHLGDFGIVDYREDCYMDLSFLEAEIEDVEDHFEVGKAMLSCVSTLDSTMGIKIFEVDESTFGQEVNFELLGAE